MMNLSKFEKDLISKFPQIESDVVEYIISNLPTLATSKKDDYELAFLVSKKLGLSRTYFSDALRKSVTLNKADVLKIDGHIYVKLDKEIVSLLEDHICMKISRDDIEDFDKHIFLTKNTILGFYK